jgi:hypothetical protein
MPAESSIAGSREGSTMSNGVAHQYTLAMTEKEREVLLDVLEEALRTTEVEEHRTDALRAKKVVHAREVAIESLLQKTRSARPD